MILVLLALLAQVQGGLTAQMGVKVAPDTVAVGDPFTLIVRVKVKPGFIAEFPQMPDSTEGRPSIIGIVGKPVIERAANDSLEFRARYTLTAWDIGQQAIPLTDIHLTGRQGTGFLPLKASVFVRSVLPQDSTLRVPKPPRARFPVTRLNWWPLIFLAAALALAELLWWIWKWYRARRNAPRDPFDVAREEFDRIDAMQLPGNGEPERHAVLTSEVMRTYLAAKVEQARASDTASELSRHVLEVGLADASIREVLEEADLLKFARARISADAAVRLGRNARSIVDMVEKQLAPKSGAEAKAA